MSRLKFRESRAVFTVDLTKEPSSLEAESQDQEKPQGRAKLPEMLEFKELVCSSDKEKEAMLAVWLLRPISLDTAGYVNATFKDNNINSQKTAAMYLLRGLARVQLPTRSGILQGWAPKATGFKLPPTRIDLMEMPLGGRELILPAVEVQDEGDFVELDPLLCNQPWYRRRQEQRNALKKVENASKAACGPFKKHWRWWRDRRIKARKKQRVI
eukprot:symbB.v1.2.024618.t1/scaffold2344.1/size81749/5